MKSILMPCLVGFIFLVFATTVEAKKQDYEPIKRAFIKQLPKPMKGWKVTKVKAGVSNSAFNKSIYAGRIYRPRRSTGLDSQVGIYIGAKPGWKTSRYQRYLDEPNAAQSAGIQIKTIGKRKVLVKEYKENYNVYVVVDKRILVTFAGKWIKAEQVQAYVKRVNYKKLARIR